MEKLAKNNQYNHYCEKCKAWKLHARGPKYYRCLVCNTKAARGLTQLAADGLVACDHVFVEVPPHGYLHCKFCNSAAAKA